MGESIPITETGRKKIGAEIAEIEARLPAVRTAIQEAREKGDLSENAEYHAAREKLGQLEAAANDLRHKLQRSQVVDVRRAPRNKVAFGASVTVLDLDSKKKVTYHLCGLGEDDPAENRILTTSPVGQGLMLKKVGEEVEFDVPGGKCRYRVLKISYPD